MKPRVLAPETGDSVALEDVVQTWLEDAGRLFEITGSHGAGKTTALEHLASLVPHDVALLDEPEAGEVLARAAEGPLIFTSPKRLVRQVDTSHTLAPWTDDEWIEYLLATYPAQCGSVMRRVCDDPFRRQLRGVPQLWRVVLDELAGDDSLPGIRQALWRHIANLLEDPKLRHAACMFCLALLLDHHVDVVNLNDELVALGSREAVTEWTRHRAVQLLCGAEAVQRLLQTGDDTQLEKRELPHDLIQELGRLAATDPQLCHRVRRLLQRTSDSRHSIAASILHAAGQTWKPRRGEFLSHAQLSGVQWEEACLADSNLFRARLDKANLSRANLKGANLCGCNLRLASCSGATLNSALLRNALLVRADLAHVSAADSDFRSADLSAANLTQGTFIRANFSYSNLTRARFDGANLSHAIFRGATIDETDFTDANLRHADLHERVLRKAALSGACFAGARLQGCDLEFVELPGADFSAADLTRSGLTGTVMPQANFRRAILCGAGLADVDWEQVDLRDADLCGCMFHMGSSRSGLVGSPYPGHGSRTGFYTDVYDDRYYKSPEEFRKANLCGADLRGANVRDVDFYLVDLRGAKYDRWQADHFRRCDAILEGG